MGLVRVAGSDNPMASANRRTKFYNDPDNNGIDISDDVHIYRTGSAITLSENNHYRYEYTYFYRLEDDLRYNPHKKLK
jgi:hypothetical protein